jgi:hypothetical protein
MGWSTDLGSELTNNVRQLHATFWTLSTRFAVACTDFLSLFLTYDTTSACCCFTDGWAGWMDFLLLDRDASRNILPLHSTCFAGLHGYARLYIHRMSG